MPTNSQAGAYSWAKPPRFRACGRRPTGCGACRVFDEARATLRMVLIGLARSRRLLSPRAAEMVSSALQALVTRKGSNARAEEAPRLQGPQEACRRQPR